MKYRSLRSETLPSGSGLSSGNSTLRFCPGPSGQSLLLTGISPDYPQYFWPTEQKVLPALQLIGFETNVQRSG